MATIELARHLYRFFPHLEGQEISVEANTAAEVIQGLERMAPGFAFYICDEHGTLRPHVNIFIGNELVTDRKALSDPVNAESRVYILQALSGG